MTAKQEGASRPLTTTQIATCRVYGGDYDVTYTYTYDDNGNILSVSDGTYTTSYVYDSQNQLIQENNQEQGCTYAWEYSEAGNIVDQMHYDYLDSDEYENYNSIAHYTYDDDWGDVLVGFGSETYTVDAIGNRTSRTNGSYTTNYTWEHGRQLASVTNGTQTWQYQYNNDGMLIEQRNGNNVYTYVYNGTQLSQMSYVGSWEEYTMHFTYDANGTPMTVTFDYVCYMDDRTYDAAAGAFLDDVEIDYTISDTYYYITNIQGDVIELLNSDGESAGYYRYDAWGKDIDMWELEDIIYYNPLRYRGYIYDRVSGYYYLQTRFYDPSVGRFINGDGLISTGQGVVGNNMFAYCNNNPVMYIDPSGQSFISTIISLLIVEEMMIKTIAVLVRYIKPLSDDEKVLIATIAAEATVTAKGTPVSSQGRQAMANVALNRVNSREWSQYDSVAEICAYTGFDGYGSRDYYKCMEYLENRNYRNITYEAIIWDVMKAYVFDITGGCQLYYTPAAMIPEGSVPYWDFSQLVEESILGVDSYYEGRFFRYK